MKNFKFLSVLFLSVAVGFSSCKKDDGDDAKASIVGKWALTKEVEIEYENGVKVEEDIETTFQSEDYIEFKSDGKVVFSEVGDTDNGTYSLSSDGKKLTITFSENSVSDIFDIKTLSSTDLVIYTEYTELHQGINYKETLEYSFKKK